MKSNQAFIDGIGSHTHRHRAGSGRPLTVGGSTRTSGIQGWLLLIGLVAALFTGRPVLGQEPIANGVRHEGNLAVAGETDSWSIPLNANDTLVVRVGAPNFPPRIRVFNGANVLVKEVSAINVNVRDVLLDLKASDAGTYSVLINSITPASTGSYALTAAQIPAAFTVSGGDEGGTMLNGASYSGTNVLGDLDLWSFAANAGDRLILRMGATGFSPAIRLYGPNGVLVSQAEPVNVNSRDVFTSAMATNSGTYTAVTGSGFANGVGPYIVTLAQAPGVIAVSPGDEGGVLQNGALNLGFIPVGDLDTWSFTAAAGNEFMVRMGAEGFPPWIRVYGPTGALVSDEPSVNINIRDVLAVGKATNAGVYTVVAGSGANDSGNYRLSLALASGAVVVTPGDQGGTLQNGARHSGSIPVGDLDTWTFSAGAGDGVMLRMGGAGFSPLMRVYGPAGTLVAEAASVNLNVRDVFLNLVATNAGNYTVVVGSTFANGTGNYDLSIVKSPGVIAVSAQDEGGPLQSGASHAGTIDVGDLDAWTFTAAPGEAILLRVGATGASPFIRLYGPNGSVVREALSVNVNVRDVELTVQAPAAGAYTVVIGCTFANQTGPYTLSYARLPDAIVTAPSDEGGTMTNGAAASGNITVGDLDFWTFSANAGDGLFLRMGASGFAPQFSIYGPKGELVAEANSVNVNIRDVVAAAKATNSGTYIVVVSGQYANTVGSYQLFYARAPGSFAVPVDDEGGALVNGVTNSASLALGDIDMWSFFGTPGDSNVFRVTATSASPWLRLYGPNGQLVGESLSANVNVRALNLIHEVTSTNAGLYTLLISASFNGQSGPYTVKQSRWAPDLIVPETAAIDEGATLDVSISAQDPDEPNKPLEFKLISSPSGATFSISGSTNARITWPTSEATGPSTNRFVASVTDVVNGRSFIRTNEFVVVVRELNLAPQLTVPGDQTVDEQTTLSVSVSATDADLPPNPLTYSLVAPLAGMAIDPATGLFTWTPSEAQGPALETVTVVVTDSSPSAANAIQLSATNSFKVTVREINRPPIFATLTVQTVDELALLTFQMSATDPDLPANTLVFSLVSAPAGVTIDPVSGVVTWRPSEDQGPSTNEVRIRVQDSGTPQLATTNSVLVVVREVNVAPQLGQLAEQTVNELATLTVMATATDSDLPKNLLTFGLVSAPGGMTIDPASGLITWKPAEDQGPSTNRVRVRVQDGGNPSLSTTNELTVVVREVNVAPVFDSIAPQETPDEVVFKVVVRATDGDLPANQLTYSLAAEIPSGATIDPKSGEFRWPIGLKTARETKNITVRVTDDGSPALTADLTFSVTIVPPPIRLMPVPDLALDEANLVTIRMAVTNSPAALPPFAFSLEGLVPDGLSINAGTGVIFWRPSEVQGPTTNRIIVRVTDSASPANSTNQTITIVVREVNVAPVIGTILTQNISPGALLSLPVPVMDEDFPPNQLTFSLLPGAPAGMTIQASTGVITWAVPTTAAAGTNSITVRVQDDGNPALESTRNIKLVVAQATELKLAIELVDGAQVRLRLSGGVGQTYLVESSADLRTWKSLTNFVSTTPVTVFNEVLSLSPEAKYYRALAP